MNNELNKLNYILKTEPPVNGEKEDEAATKIQSAFRGHEVRQDEEVKTANNDQQEEKNETSRKFE